MEKKVSIIFCGGCNPRIDRGLIAEEVRAILAGQGYRVSFNCRKAGYLIYLSGCLGNCAQRYSTVPNPCTVVAATTVDTTAIDQTLIVAEIVEKVRSFFG